MDGRRLHLPTGSTRLVVATMTACSLMVPVTGAVGAGAFAAGQSPGTPLIGPDIDRESRFDVVSIKAFDASGNTQARVTMTPGRFDFAGLPLRLLVGQGVRATLDRIFGWPDWIDTERYMIAARMPDGAPQAALLVAVENLLKDRFKLVTHREMRELPVYNLVLARGDRRLGPAIKESPPQCQTAVRDRLEAFRRAAPGATASPTAAAGCVSVQLGMGTVTMNGTPISAFVNLLTQAAGRPVVDKTGLTALYDFTLKWTPDVSGTPAPFGLPAGVPQAPPPPADPDVPNIFTAVQEQLGLKLEAGRGPVEVVVIDRLEKPALD